MELYICGSNLYDPNEPDDDWPCDPIYFPNRRYAQSGILREIHEIVSQFDDSLNGVLAEHIVLGLGYAGLAVRDLCRTIPRKLLLGKRASRAVAVAIDDGPIIMLDDIVPPKKGGILGFGGRK